jgi:hypothetical protein
LKFVVVDRKMECRSIFFGSSFERIHD